MSTIRLLCGLLAGGLALLGTACEDGDESEGGGGDTDTDTDADTDTGTSTDEGGEYPFDISGMEWANVPGGLDVPTPETFEDKVVFVACFQAW